MVAFFLSHLAPASCHVCLAQLEEFESLQAIYGEDCVKLVEGAR